jgi:hypothetical protein
MEIEYRTNTISNQKSKVLQVGNCLDYLPLLAMALAFGIP